MDQRLKVGSHYSHLQSPLTLPPHLHSSPLTLPVPFTLTPQPNPLLSPLTIPLTLIPHLHPHPHSSRYPSPLTPHPSPSPLTLTLTPHPSPSPEPAVPETVPHPAWTQRQHTSAVHQREPSPTGTTSDCVHAPHTLLLVYKHPLPVALTHRRPLVWTCGKSSYTCTFRQSSLKISCSATSHICCSCWCCAFNCCSSTQL